MHGISSDMESCETLSDKFDRHPELFKKVYSGTQGSVCRLKSTP